MNYICYQGVLCKVENWHALSHEQYFSKNHFLDICQCAFKVSYLTKNEVIFRKRLLFKLHQKC